jgi:hypothetical protein
MARWHEPKLVPTILPVSRLYLEDIEEIANILRNGSEAKDGTKITFRVGRELCDDVKDLPMIARKTLDLEIKAKGQNYTARFGVSRFITTWTTTGLSREEAWIDFHNLEALFERRKLRWRTFFHTSKEGIRLSLAVGMLTAGVTVLLNVALLFKLIPLGRWSYLLNVIIPIVLLLDIVLLSGLFRNGGVILRNSWDHEAAREDFRMKIIAGIVPALIGAVLGGGIALLGVYLRHKYWP